MMKLLPLLMLFAAVILLLVACVAPSSSSSALPEDTNMKLVAKHGYVEVWRFIDGLAATTCYVAITTYSASSSPSIFCLP